VPGQTESSSGVPVSSLRAAISWSGTNVTLCLFVVWPARDQVEIAPPAATTQPRMVRTYQLQDEESVLGQKSISELDLIFDDVPDDIDAVVEG
jgi:hypothetical protein